MASNIDIISNATNPATSQTAAATASLGKDFTTFLTLLTTQLKNQDPTSPLETDQFTQQIAVLSQVEQGINTNKNLEKLIANSASDTLSTAVSYIGKSVESFPGDKGVLLGGVASFAYDLPPTAKTTEISITNATGQTVYTGAGTSLSGKNIVYWDGKSSFDGTQQADGIYTVKVTAKDASGVAVKSSTYTSGLVTSVDIVNGTPTLKMGTLPVDLKSVSSIRTTI